MSNISPGVGPEADREEQINRHNYVMGKMRYAYVAGYLTALDETGIDSKDYDYRKGAEDEAQELYPDAVR